MASAVWRTSDSSRPLHANWFQLFHPIDGGVAFVALLITARVGGLGTKPGVVPSWLGPVRVWTKSEKTVRAIRPIAKQRTKADFWRFRDPHIVVPTEAHA